MEYLPSLYKTIMELKMFKERMESKNPGQSGGGGNLKAD